VGGDAIVIRRAVATDAARMAAVWLRSYAAALPTVRRAHSDDQVREWFQRLVVPEREAWVAVADDSAAGMTGLLVLGAAAGWVTSS
jgi:hypothetical protein